MFAAVEAHYAMKHHVDVNVMRNGQCVGHIHAAHGVVVVSSENCSGRSVSGLRVALYEFGDPNWLDFEIVA